MCPVWKKYTISNSRFLPTVVKIALKVVMVVAIGNNVEKIREREKKGGNTRGNQSLQKFCILISHSHSLL